MLLISLVVSLVVAAPQSDDAPTSARPLDAERVQAPPDAVNFDELPEPPKAESFLGDQKRVQRFLGALAGGLVGFGALVAFMPLGEDPFCIGCASGAQLALGAFAPVVGALGAWLGATLLGGQAGPLTPFMGLAPALVLALSFVLVADSMGLRTTVQHVPFIVVAGAFLAGGAAFALDVREQQLGGLGRAQSWGGASAGRVSLTALTGAGTTAVAGFLSVLLGVLNPFAGIVAGLVQGFGVAAATWGVHKAMGGRGSIAAALAALGLGGALTAGAIAVLSAASSSFISLRTTSTAMMAVQLGVLSSVLLPTIALEWAHTAAVGDRLPKVSLGAAPTAQGGMVSAGVRF